MLLSKKQQTITQQLLFAKKKVFGKNDNVLSLVR